MTPEDRAFLTEIAALAEKATRPTKHAGYFVCSDGAVWSSIPWRGQSLRPLTPKPNSHGYLAVKVRTSTGMRKALVHKLVCDAFHGPKPTPIHEVRHLDGNKTNNSSDNLAWGTRSENAQDRKRHGTERSAENGRRGADKLRRYTPTCRRGHDKEGRTSCEECRRILRRAKRAA